MLVLLVASSAQAHSSITDEKEVGNYRVVLSYFGDAAFVDEAVGFNIYVYPKVEGAVLITPADGAVKVFKKDGAEIFSGPLDVADPDAPAYFKYTFAETGDHMITLSLKMETEQLPDVSFPLHVYASPLDAYKAVSGEEEKPALGFIGWGAATLIIVAAGAWFCLRSRSSPTN